MRKLNKMTIAVLSAAMMITLGGMTTVSADDSVELTMTAGLTTEHIITTMGNEFADKVAEATNGEVTIKFYPGDTLGNSSERAQMLIAGDIDIDVQALSAFDSYNPRQGVINAFFMFENWDHYRKFTDSDLYDEIIQGLEDTIHVINLGDVYYARRNFLSTKPIESLEDLKGMKFRVPNEEMPIACIGALGAAPTPMAGSEVYTSLQNKTIEATENGAEQIVAQAFYEVAPYMTRTAHQYQTMNFLMSEAGREKLTDEHFETISTVFDEIVEKYDTLCQESEAENEKILEEKITVSDIDLTNFYAAMEPVYSEYDSVWGEGCWQEIKAMAE